MRECRIVLHQIHVKDEPNAALPKRNVFMQLPLEHPFECANRTCKSKFQNTGDREFHMKTYHQRGIKKTYTCFICKKKI